MHIMDHWIMQLLWVVSFNHRDFSSGDESDKDITDVDTKPCQKYTDISIKFLVMQAPL